MDDPGSATPLYVQFIILFLLILVNAFFAMSEIAIIGLNDNKIERMAEDGHKKAKQVMKLTSNSSNFLSTIQIGVTLAGFLTSASASQTLATRFSSVLMSSAIANSGFMRSIIPTLSMVIITIIMSYFSLVFGELAPKRIAMQVPEKISFKVIGILLFFSKITKPFVRLLSASTNVVVRLLGFDPNANDGNVTEEEIRMMVDVGQEKGVIEDSQKEMINNIFEFDDIDAGDIMTHRTDMVAVDVDAPLSEVVDLAIENGYSRIPVYEDDQDNIVGIVYVKDLLIYIGKTLPQNETIKKIMRSAVYVPESKNCGDLFKEMTESRAHMAVVVDEYGGTAGILTMEDIIESIVGNIRDEYDEDEDDEISKINETTFTIDGTTDIEEVEEILGTQMPMDDYDTLGGFLIYKLGFLPKDGEMNVVEYENLIFTILNVEDRRIGKIKVEILPSEEAPEQNEKRERSRKDKEN